MKIYSLLRQYPILRLLLFFVCGIMITYQLQSQFIFILNYFCIITLIFLSLNIALSNTGKFKYLYAFSVFSTYILLGCTLTLLRLTLPSISNTEKLFTGIVYEEPQKKKKSVLVPVIIDQTHTNQKFSYNRCKVQLYARHSTENIDQIGVGDIIAFKANIHKISNLNNPDEFNYAQYMANQGVYYSGFVISKKIVSDDETALNFTNFIAKIRTNADEIINTNIQNDEGKAIIRALTLGNKHYLSDELKQSFANAGAMHVLAVSGLHIGILYGFLNIIFGFLNKTKQLRALKIILSILIIWGYATLTGLSPSVCRAALMFSVISFGKTINRNISYYNLLAFAALILLVINPLMLFDVGFQLSFLAVGGIVYFQPRFYNLISINNTVLDWVYKLLTVSVAAQLSTAPLTIFYFNQFPTYFWLTNIFLIPLILVVMVSSVFLYAFYWFELAAEYISKFLEITLDIIHYGIRFIEHLPYSVIQNITTNHITTLFLFILLITATQWINIRKPRHLMYSLSIIIIIYSYNLVLQYTAKYPDIVFYNTPRSSYVSIIHNGKAKLLYSNNSEYHTKLVQRYFEPQLSKNKKISNTELISIDSILSQYKSQSINNFLLVNIEESYSIFFAHNQLKNIPQNTMSDITFVSGAIWPPKKGLKTQEIVLGNKLYYKQREAWKSYTKEQNIKTFDLTSSGAYRIYLPNNDTIYNSSILPQRTD